MMVHCYLYSVRRTVYMYVLSVRRTVYVYVLNVRRTVYMRGTVYILQCMCVY